MFKLFLSDGTQGSGAEVWIDEDAGLCKKIFKPNSISVSGRAPIYNTPEMIDQFYHNEVFWSTQLKSNFVVELYEHGKLNNDYGYYIIQEYVGPDLLICLKNGTLFKKFPDIKDQLEEMFKFFQTFNFYKHNSSLANLTGCNGKIKAFDFKYASPRSTNGRAIEIYSIENWIAQDVGPNLVEHLSKYL